MTFLMAPFIKPDVVVTGHRDAPGSSDIGRSDSHPELGSKRKDLQEENDHTNDSYRSHLTLSPFRSLDSRIRRANLTACADCSAGHFSGGRPLIAHSIKYSNWAW